MYTHYLLRMSPLVNILLFCAHRTPVYALYLMSFLYDIIGLKKYGKYYFAVTIELLKTEEGRGKLASYF